MPRLPQPGGDNGQWGQILNDYLSVEHNADGTLKKASDIAAKYEKPNTGIPAGDLSTATQTSLTKADSSVQSVNAKFPSSGNVTLTANDVNAIPTSEKGASGGVASLDADSKLFVSQLPESVTVKSVVPPISDELVNLLTAQPAILIPTSIASTGISGSVLKNANHADFRYSCGTSVTQTTYRAAHGYQSSGGTNIGADAPFVIEFGIDARYFEIPHYAYANVLYRLFVDGVPHAANPVALPNTDNTARLLSFDLGVKKNAQIRIEAEGAFIFGGVRTAITDSVFPPTSRRPRVAWIGDSHGLGSPGPTYKQTSILPTLGKLIGWDIWQTTCRAGTGYLANAGNRKNYRDRLAYEIYPHASMIDAVIVQSSTNDGVLSANNALYPQILATITDLRVNLPGVRILMCTHIDIGADQSGGNYARVDAQTRAAAQALGVQLIDTQPPTWWSGTGKVGAPANDGTADVYRASDGVHETDLGTQYQARRLAASIKTLQTY